MKNMEQSEKAQLLRGLHHSGKMVVLPNIWDPIGALLLEDLGYPAVATASASVAYSNGYNDGEQIAFETVLQILKHIAGAVTVPVTADIESGYSETTGGLKTNIERLLETGIVGINVEDTNKSTGRVYELSEQCERLQKIKEVAFNCGVPLFINARTDALLPGHGVSPEIAMDEVIRRGLAYKEAGADCFYPITLKDVAGIKRVVNEVNMPVNILAMPGLPDLRVLAEMGVMRLSLGPGFLKTALSTMKQAAVKLLRLEGLDEVTSTDITSDYLKKLVIKD